jgi:hypothetical protein
MTNVDTTPEMLPMNGSMVTDITHIDLDCIRCDEDIQTREVREGEALDQLRELYRDDPDALPPVIVFLDDWGDYWLADGFYRVKVAREAMGTGAPHTIRAEVRKGTKRNAILCAVTANAKHGLPLTAAEKRGVVERLLQDPEWGLWADRVIARHCGVSHEFVRQRRASLSTVDSDHTQTRTYINRWGNQDTMETANIGQAASASTPVDGEWMEPVVTKGLDKLQNAWRAASPPARRAFREWMDSQPDDLYVVSPSQKTVRYNEVIAQACMPVLLATAPDGFDHIPGARSQGSAPWQTQVIALGVPLLEHFPLDPVSYLQYKTSINLTLWYAAWRRHGTTVCARQHRLAISLYPAGLGTDPAYRASLCAHPT